MSASDKLPITVTYAPPSGVTTTVTVLGQVLNNGQTNWIPTNGHAIYVATSSESRASTTVVDGSTYYFTTGPAVPDQVTISVAPSSSPASQTAPRTTSGQVSTAPSGSSSGSASTTPTSQSFSAAASQSPSASASSSTTKSGASSRSLSSVRKMDYLLAFGCVAAVLTA